MIATWSHPQSENERKQSVNNFVCCTLYNPRAVLRHLCIIKVFTAFIGNIVCVNTVAHQNDRQQSLNSASTEHQQSINRASTQCQRIWVLHHIYSKGSATPYVHKQRIGSHSVQMRSYHVHSTCLNIIVNKASTILCVASCIIQGLCYGIDP